MRSCLMLLLPALAAPVASTAPGGRAAEASGPRPAHLDLWLYHSTNLWVDKNIDRLEAVWRRARAAGYTRVLLADSKFAKLGDMDRRYFANIERVKTLARDLKLEIVPALFPVGYSNDMLWHDPNLAEGLPVRGALFVVKGGEARIAADPPVVFHEGFAGKDCWKDDCLQVEGGVATVRDHDSNARLVQKFKVARFRCYHVSVKIKTEDYTGEPRIQALANGKPLQFASLGAERTQDWKEHHAVFNSLENEEVSVYLGSWGGARGTLRWKDWRIEEAGPVNLLRREGAPLAVEGHSEGRDFERLEDPLMGSKPWKGEYTVWHEPPVLKTKLPDGTKLRVSWYHAATIHEGQVSSCLSEARVMEILRDQAKRMREAWATEGYMMSHDEIRTLNWDASCRKRGLDAGAILAANARDCVQLLEGSTAYVWSDMFDPHHNAVKDYYLVRGDLSGSWEGLDPKVVVVNWNFGKRDRSLLFFAKRGHKQVIAGYYDGPVSQAREWLESAAKVQGVIGIMYTTWKSNYEDLEAFAKACRE